MDVDALLKNVPLPSEESMAARAPLRRQFTLVFLRNGPARRDDDARSEELHLQHLQHLTKLQILNKLLWNGPVLIEHDIIGVSLYEADVDEARLLAAADPKVRAGYLTVEALPWLAFPSDSEAQRRSGA